MIEMKVAKKHEPDTTLLCQGKLRADRATVQQHRVVNEKSTTLLPNQPISSIHKTVRPVASQHSNLHLVSTIG